MCIAVSFSQQEADAYLKVDAEASAAYQNYRSYNSLLAIMSLLGPLRRCCSVGALPDRVRHTACMTRHARHFIACLLHTML